jgi:hypothetical protein
MVDNAHPIGSNVNSLAQLLSVMQNGVTAINNLTLELNGIFPGSAGTTTVGSTAFTSKFSGISLQSTANIVLTPYSSTRYGIIFHNPGTVNAYVYQTGMATNTPSPSSVLGSFIIYPGGTLTFPSGYYSNINAGFSGFCSSGSSQPFTVVEFF